MSEWRKALMRGGRRGAALVALAVVTAGNAPAIHAATSELPVFGMLGVARGQDAVLSLVLVHALNPDHPGCRVTASFEDARGQLLRDAQGNPVQQTFVLRDHVSAALTLRGADILGAQLRRPTRAVLSEPPDDGTLSDCNCVMATEELVNTTTGKTDSGLWAQRPTSGGNPPPPPTCFAPAPSGP